MKNAEKRRPGYGVVVPIGRSQARQARFGPFILDFGRRTLVRDDERLHLTPKPFETLAFLLENSGRTVSKQELLDAVWGNAAVTEDTLVKAVREVRRVLGDDRDEPTFVQTVPREGYRFVAPVSFDRTDSETAAPPAPARPRRTWVLAIGLLTASGALVATLSHWGAVEDLPRSPRQRVLLAGLPGE